MMSEVKLIVAVYLFIVLVICFTIYKIAEMFA